MLIAIILQNATKLLEGWRRIARAENSHRARLSFTCTCWSPAATRKAHLSSTDSAARPWPRPACCCPWCGGRAYNEGCPCGASGPTAVPAHGRRQAAHRIALPFLRTTQKQKNVPFGQCSLSEVRNCAVPPDHSRTEISFSRTCNIPNLEAKKHQHVWWMQNASKHIA